VFDVQSLVLHTNQTNNLREKKVHYTLSGSKGEALLVVEGKFFAATFMGCESPEGDKEVGKEDLCCKIVGCPDTL
jgi:hypothetical protein